MLLLPYIFPCVKFLQQEKYFILEVNGTSSGLLPEHTEADNKHICGLVIRRLAALASEDHGL
jgi:hypothetical protein